MAQEREAQGGKASSAGRGDNAAQPLDASRNKRGPERYPSVRQDDAIERSGFGERRSFERTDRAAAPDDTADDASRDGGQKEFEGPQADPAEGKR